MIKTNEPSSTGIAAVMKSVIDMCNNNSKPAREHKLASKGGGNNKDIVDQNVVAIENLSFPDLYAMIEQHKLHLNF